MKRIVRQLMPAMLVLSACVPAARAYDLMWDGIYYNYSSGGGNVIVTYRTLQDPGYTGHVNIPEQIQIGFDRYPVRGISDHAMFNCTGVTAVSLPEGLNSIGDQAFSHCPIRSVTLPSTLLRISDFAFEYCDALTSVTIPASVASFGYGVLWNCASLREINVEPGNSLLKSVGGVLYSADGTLLVQYPAGRTDAELTIADGVTAVTDYAFCPAPHLRTISIGATLGRVPELAFADCYGLESIMVDEANKAMKSVDGMLLTAACDTLIQYPAACPSHECVLPDRVTAVGPFAFYGCKYLTSLTVGAAEPPTLGENAIPVEVAAGATLYVPDESVEAYAAAAGWNAFADIRPIIDAQVAEVEAGSRLHIEGNLAKCPGELIEVVDLTGRMLSRGTDRVSLPDRGSFLVRAAGTTLKLIR